MILVLRVAVATALAMPIAVTAQPERVADTGAVEAVLSQYKAAIKKLDAKGTEDLFAVDSQIFETGGYEGTYTSKHPVRAAGAQAVSRFGQRNGAEPRTKPRNAAWRGNATLKPGMPSTKNP